MCATWVDARSAPLPRRSLLAGAGIAALGGASACASRVPVNPDLEPAIDAMAEAPYVTSVELTFGMGCGSSGSLRGNIFTRASPAILPLVIEYVWGLGITALHESFNGRDVSFCFVTGYAEDDSRFSVMEILDEDQQDTATFGAFYRYYGLT